MGRACLISLFLMRLVLPLRQSRPVVTVGVPLWMDIPAAYFDAFEAEHNVEVVLVKAEEGAFWLLPVDNPTAHLDNIERYVQRADVLLVNRYLISPLDTRAGYYLDLTPLINADPTLDPEVYYPAVWPSFQWEGGMWALPATVQLTLFAYDPAAFDVEQLAETARVVGFYTSQRDVLIQGWAGADTLPDVMEQWQALTAAGVLVDDWGHEATPARPFTMDTSLNIRFTEGQLHGAALPNGTGITDVIGLAVSSGTPQPELAYALAKYISTHPEPGGAFLGDMPALRDAPPPQVEFVPPPSPELQSVIEQVLTTGRPLSDFMNGEAIDNALHLMAEEGISPAEALQQQADRWQAGLAEAESRRTILHVDSASVPADDALRFGVNAPVPLDHPAWQTITAAADVQVTPFNSASVLTEYDCYFTVYDPHSLPVANLLPLDPYLDADPTYDRADALVQVQEAGLTYGVPLAIYPYQIGADTAQFEAAGVPLPAPDWTISDFESILRDLTAATGQAAFSGLTLTGALLLIEAYGGAPPLDYTTTPPTINFTDPTTLTAMQQVLDLARQGLIAYTPEMSLPVNVTAPLWGGTPDRAEPERVPLAYPRGTEGHPVAVQVGAAYIQRDTARADACYQWINTLRQQPELWGGVPAYRSQLASDFARLFMEPLTAEKGTNLQGDFVLDTLLLRVMDRYVLSGADLAAELSAAQQIAQDYLTCVTVQNPAPEDGTAQVQARLDCATAVDPTLLE